MAVAWVGLTVMALVTAIAVLFVVKATSSQSRIALVKREIVAGLFEMRLFAGDPRAVLRAQAGILINNLRYLRLSLVPMLWMAVPLVLLVAQLQPFFGYVGLEPGKPAIVKLHVNSDVRPEATLEAPEGIHVDGPPVWIPSAREMDWRVTPAREGAYALTVHLGGHDITKDVRVSNFVARYSPVRAAGGFFNRLWHPAEAPLPKDVAVDSIEINYAQREFNAIGWPLPWTVAFLLLTMGWALLLRKSVGVTL